MRFKLNFELENEKFPIQYRKNVMSFIKKSLNEYSPEHYEKLYHKKDNIIKPYTFAVFFNTPEFKENEIILKDKKFTINISIENYEIAIILYNSFNNQKYKKFSLNQNSWTLQNITMTMEKEITTDKINIKFLSPLIARNREDKKDHYYSFSANQFLETVKINIREQLKITNLPEGIENTFEIKPIQAKKVIVKFYEKKIEGSIGTFEISGDRKLLEVLYQSGIGSKRSAGFGMFEII